MEVIGEHCQSSWEWGAGGTGVSDGGKRGWMMSGLCFYVIGADWVMRRASFITLASLFGDVFEMFRDKKL